jgi:PPM family protein phosphatase
VGRASIVGAAETSVGKVREHNEDAHFIDPEAGIFIVCDGMGGHAAGEVASSLAVQTIRRTWTSPATLAVADRWLDQGTPDARKQLIATVQQGVLAAHDAIVTEATVDRSKHGMGTTVVAAMVVGADVVFAHCGDSRAYLVRDGITVQLTEDHTLLQRLLAAGVDVDVDGDGSRFRSMLTNALGIGHECTVSTFIVPVADGDRFLLCSDGITEYLEENEIGEVLTTMPSPARSAQRLVEIALQRGGGDNATALVVRVLEAGETARPSDQLRREELAINACPLWAKVNAQQRLRALRVAVPRDHAINDKLPAHTLGDRVAWILVEGEVEQDGHLRGPGSLLYPEALLGDRPLPDKHGLAVAQSEVRALALRFDDFKELCEAEPDLGEHLLGALAIEVTRRRPHRRTGKIDVEAELARADTAQYPGVSAGDEISSVPSVPSVPSEAAARIGRVEIPALGTRNGSVSPPPDRSSLIVAPADTAAAVDDALIGMTSGPTAVLADSHVDPASEARDDTSEPEIRIEAGSTGDDDKAPGRGAAVVEVLQDTTSSIMRAGHEADGK